MKEGIGLCWMRVKSGISAETHRFVPLICVNPDHLRLIGFNSLVEEATERRMWLQFSANAEWPHTAPANTPIRREFQLPANRAFTG
jgi:hypothetical protein